MKVMVPKANTLSLSETPEFIKSPIKLTISLLVSNRIGSIRKCMESLKVILDTIPSELIAVDTVGEENSDGSLEVVREYTDKIIHFDWTGDFSAARNAGLAHAQGEWFLYVDDDEWFDDPRELIEFFQNGDYLKYGCTQYRIRNYTDMEMTEYEDSWVSRMGRRTKGMRFVYAVHELMRPLYSPEKIFSNLFAHHVGYVFDNVEDKKKHFERNITPVLEELERHPGNLRLTMQAVQEYMFAEDYEKAEALCRSAEKNEDPSYERAWNWIEVMLLRSLLVRDRAADTISEGRRILESPRINDLARMNIDYIMIAAAQKVKDTETELEFSCDYARLVRYFDEYPEKILDHVVLSLGEILKNDKRKKVHDILFLNYKNLERYSELCEYADNIPWNAEYMKQKLHFLFLIEAVADTGNYDCLTRVTKKICQQGEFPRDWMEEIYKICNCEDKDKRRSFRTAFAAVESEEEYFLILKAWCAEQNGTDIQKVLQKCLERGMDCAVPREELLGICLRNDIDPMPFLGPLYFEDWVLSFVTVVKQTEKEKLNDLMERGQETLSAVSQQKSDFLAKTVYQRFLEDPDLEEDQLCNVAENYVKYTLQYYHTIYRAEMFEEKGSLPRDSIFSLQLKNALKAKVQGNLNAAFVALKECVKAFPARKDFVSRLITQIEQEIEEEQVQQQEFINLGEQIKKQIYYLISLGETEQAQQVLERLRILTPNDQELDIISQQI